MTGCDDKMLLLHAFVDGELDAGNSLSLEEHLRGCAACREELERIETLRLRVAETDASYRAPDALRRQIEAAIDAAGPGMAASERKSAGRHARPTRPLGDGLTRVAAGLLVGMLSGAALMSFLSGGDAPGSLQDQFIASHVRSLQPGHLTDVTTSDRHQVKPWFNGRVDFAPPVPELATQGFPLVGGRLDYAGGRAVAAIVYGRRLHRINLFVRPAESRDRAPDTAKFEGYNIVHWSAGGLDYWAVSDLNAKELGLFQRLFVAAK